MTKKALKKSKTKIHKTKSWWVACSWVRSVPEGHPSTRARSENPVRETPSTDQLRIRFHAVQNSSSPELDSARKQSWPFSLTLRRLDPPFYFDSGFESRRRRIQQRDKRQFLIFVQLITL